MVRLNMDGSKDHSFHSRRKFLQQLAALSLGPSLVYRRALAATEEQKPDGPVLTQEDEAFLDDLEHKTFLYFWEQANPQTGLIKDRCNVRVPDTYAAASIASTGFGLTGICIAEKRGFISYQDARLRVITTLDFLWKKLPTHRGFFFHFANINTGERIWDSEVSSIDTAILICGILTCRQYFHDRDIMQLARAIFDRVDWTWLSEDVSLLGMGSATHPLPAGVWDAWKRITFEYDGLRYIGSFAPLFVHQYSQAWFDFRHKRDKYADYFQNSATATEVHRRFCIELHKYYSDYSEDLWGITASDSEKGYVVWGGPPAMGPIDGTVVPAAAGGSLPFLPDATMRVLKNIKNRYPQAWSRYGFVDAFNPLKNWYDTDLVGIDAGIILLMAENLRTGFVWKTFMKNPEAQRGMEKAGFKNY